MAIEKESHVGTAGRDVAQPGKHVRATPAYRLAGDLYDDSETAQQLGYVRRGYVMLYNAIEPILRAS